MQRVDRTEPTGAGYGPRIVVPQSAPADFAPSIPFDWPRSTIALVAMSAITAVLQLLAQHSPLAETTDVPLDIATFLLFGATGGLAVAAFKGLGQLKQAQRQLDAANRDRHTQILISLIDRWSTPEMAEAFKLQHRYTAITLLELFKRNGEPVSKHPPTERRRLDEVWKREVLIRIPNFFEDAVMLAKFASKDSDAGLREQLLEQFGPLAAMYWVTYWEDTVQYMRDVDDDQKVYEHFKGLADDARGAVGVSTR